MKKRSYTTFQLIVALLALVVSNAPSFAQLGPKDTENLKPTEIDRVKIGDPAPDFTLEDADGKPVTLSDYRGKKSVVLVFYRGYW